LEAFPIGKQRAMPPRHKRRFDAPSFRSFKAVIKDQPFTAPHQRPA
jgi:hypothetical protein